MDVPVMAAAMAAAVATLLTVALPTQAAMAAAVAAAVLAAVPQIPVLEDVQAAAKSLAVRPSMTTIIAWKIITGPAFLHPLHLIQYFYRSLSESYKARAAHARAHMC